MIPEPPRYAPNFHTTGFGRVPANKIFFIKASDKGIMGARRAGYFTGLVIMILGIIMVPVGVILMAGGVFDSIQSGDADMFMGGIVMIIFGIIMFVVGLVLSIVLKKSGGENVNITISAHEGVMGMPEADPMLNINRQETLGGAQDNPVLDVLPEPKLPSQDIQDGGDKGKQNMQERPAEQVEEEEVSLQDMVMDLQEAGRGERARLEYIAKRLGDNRTIYNTDKEYVKRQFANLRAEITKEENANPN